MSTPFDGGRDAGRRPTTGMGRVRDPLVGTSYGPGLGSGRRSRSTGGLAEYFSVDEEDGDTSAERFEESTRRVDRWSWGLGLALLLASLALGVRQPSLLVAAIVPLGLVAYGAITGIPRVELVVERSVSHSATAPGEHVPVELTVTNEGAAALTDVRLVDGVPEALPVVEGAPRAALDLAPGESATVTYEVGARRGVHEFLGTRIRVRNTSGSALAQTAVAADGDAAVECELPVGDVPLARDTILHPGAVGGDEHGEGVEFYAVREYRRGDDPTDIDWRRYARTGEVTTVRYREERAATIVLLVDARDRTYVSATHSTPSAARLSAFAAERSFEALARGSHDVGLATLRAGGATYVEPGSGPATLAEARDVLEDVYERDPVLSVNLSRNGTGSASASLESLERRLPGRSQVVLFSPATDEFAEHLVRGLRAHGWPVTVVSPNVVTEDEPGQQLQAAERSSRIVDLRAAGARVVEWDRTEPLPLVLERATTWGARP